MALAAVAAVRGRFQQVATLLGTADTLCGRSGIPLAFPDYMKVEALADVMDIPAVLATARSRLGQRSFEAAWQAGAARSPADVVFDSFDDANAIATAARAQMPRAGMHRNTP
jgi:hypothetical protein